MTLVSFIGDFFSSVGPVFYHLKDKLSTHIIVSDDSKRDDRLARKFQKGVSKFCEKYNLNIKNLYYTLDEDSFDSLEKAKNFILENSSGDIYLNTTDGLSTINTFFSLKMLPLNAKIISYDMFDNEYNLISINGVERVKMGYVPIKDHFLLKGVDILETGMKSFAIRYENEIRELFEDYDIHREYKAFKYDITTYNHLPKRDKFPNIYYLFDKMKLTNRDNLSFDHLFQVVTGDMFEYYLYLIVKDMGFDDIEIGVEIEYDDVVNEFDLLLMKDNHLHIIECKHRSHKTLNIDNIIYKYGALKRIVDEDAKAIIVTLINRYNKHSIDRALSHDIALFGFNKYLHKNIKRYLIEDDYDFYLQRNTKNKYR